jgi:hypothetical protein
MILISYSLFFGTYKAFFIILNYYMFSIQEFGYDITFSIIISLVGGFIFQILMNLAIKKYPFYKKFTIILVFLAVLLMGTLILILYLDY